MIHRGFAAAPRWSTIAEPIPRIQTHVQTTEGAPPGLAALLLPAGEAQAFKCVPLYDNWCSPGHPSATALPLVDAFDAACMRHDLCIAGAWSETPCDRAFVDELHLIDAQAGYLPRPLQWAEYLIRVKAGGGWGGCSYREDAMRTFIPLEVKTNPG